MMIHDSFTPTNGAKIPSVGPSRGNEEDRNSYNRSLSINLSPTMQGDREKIKVSTLGVEGF